jgi:hypothetical protein
MDIKMFSNKKTRFIAMAGIGIFASGCSEDPTIPPAPVTGTTSAAAPAFQYKGRTGVPVAVGDPKLIASRIAERSFSSRPDPFALLPVERSFDQSQAAERLTQDLGYSTMYEPPQEVAAPDEVIEPQPYRRLAGILVGDTVSAILIMEDGSAHIIRPGMRLPNSPWRVVSIDEEKAVLRRAGNVKPTQIIVRLETPPGGVPSQGGGGGRPGGGGGRFGSGGGRPGGGEGAVGGRPGGGGPGRPGGDGGIG